MKQIFSIAFLLIPFLIQAQNGTPDITFGNNGIVTTPVGSLDDDLTELLIQPDGKIIASGFIYQSTSTTAIAMVRYMPDGSLDNTFGNGGKVIYSNGLSENFAGAAVLQPDGKIILGGLSYSTPVSPGIIVRFLPDGTVDNSFGVSGEVLDTFGLTHSNIRSMVLQPDGKLIVAGEGEINSIYYAIVARYNSDGSRDTLFGTGGLRVDSIGSYLSVFYSVALQPDGKIIACGNAAETSGYNYDFLVMRYLPDGTPDPGFGTAGYVRYNLNPATSAAEEAESIILLPDGSILAAGQAEDSIGDDHMVVLKLTAAGIPDPTFGIQGVKWIPLGIGMYDIGYSIKAQFDGKLLVAGYCDNGNDSDFLIVRLNADGSVDNSFGTNGRATFDFTADSDIGYRMILQPDGKIVFGGYSKTTPQNYDFKIIRLNNISSGIIDQHEQAAIQIYPNPAINMVKVICEPSLIGSSFKVFDATGRQVHSAFISEKEMNYNFNNLPAGIYTLSIDNRIFTNLIVAQH